MRNKKLIILFSVLLAVTLLVVFNSVLFSVQRVDVYCANVKESVLADNVRKSHKIKRGSSIFFVNKDEVTKRVEKSVPGIRVLNIEKQFPNKIYINYVEVKEYVKVTSGVKTYYCGNDMRVMRIENGLGDDDSDGAIRLKYRGSLSDLDIGDTLTFETSSGLSAASVVTEIFRGLERLGYYDTVMDLLDDIDLSGNFVVLTTSTGLKWEIVTTDRLAEKLRFAYSVYVSDKFDDSMKREGTLVIAGSDRLVANYRRPGSAVEGL